MIEFVLGDLREEYGILCAERGRRRARWWYARQILLSLLLLIRPLLIRPGDVLRASAPAIPLILLDRLWCFVYSLIPLKDGLDRAPGFLMANVVAACAAVALFRPRAMWAVLSTALAMAVAVSAEPPLYVALALVSVSFTARLRRVA
jgi:hypothetical protein